MEVEQIEELGTDSSNVPARKKRGRPPRSTVLPQAVSVHNDVEQIQSLLENVKGASAQLEEFEAFRRGIPILVEKLDDVKKELNKWRR